MLIILSPAKKLDFASKTTKTIAASTPIFEDETKSIISVMQKQNPQDLESLMSISPALAKQNFDRYQDFDHINCPTKPALLAFKGEVYSKIDISDYTSQDLEFAQHHLYILSGLYGLLRSLDLIKPYRLEMGTTITIESAKNLYDFWQEKITTQLSTIIKTQKMHVLINLASNEYSKAIDFKKLPCRTINITFKNLHNGQHKIIGILAKRARGMMTNFIIKNRIDDIKDLKPFNQAGYKFDPTSSDDNNYVFLAN